jgi:tRNA (guanine-N7-)-methyltransferase
VLQRPLEIEIGSSHGEFICHIAREHPERNFLGIEIIAEKCSDATARAQANKLTNVRIVHAEAHAYIRHHIITKTVSAIHVYFPTPYPNGLNRSIGLAKPLRARLLSPAFVTECYRVLAPDATLRVATDHAGYFRTILSLLRPPEFSLVPWHSPLRRPSGGMILGTGCERLQNRKRQIHLAQFIRLFGPADGSQTYSPQVRRVG